MKKRLLLVVLFYLTNTGLLLFAQQDNDEKRKLDFEKFKMQREEYITKAMDLTNDEVKVFWPLCNELQAKKFELNKTLRAEIRKIRRSKQEGKAISEADYKKVVELSVSIKVKEAQLEEEYMGKFLAIISAEKVFLYQQAEMRFANEKFGNRERRNPR
jgi:Spy/CpxP family protein refolding chaperone